MTGSADLLKAKEEIWELKMQNIIVTERWERLQRETASLKTVSHGTKESFSLQRQQALCLNTLFYFFAQASEEEIRKVQTLQDVWKHQVRHLCMAAINVSMRGSKHFILFVPESKTCYSIFSVFGHIFNIKSINKKPCAWECSNPNV